MTNDVDTVCKWGLTKGWTHFLKAEKKNHIEILAFFRWGANSEA